MKTCKSCTGFSGRVNPLLAQLREAPSALPSSTTPAPAPEPQPKASTEVSAEEVAAIPLGIAHRAYHDATGDGPHGTEDVAEAAHERAAGAAATATTQPPLGREEYL